MNGELNPAQDPQVRQPEEETHFWVCCAPFFETTLLVVPSMAAAAAHDAGGGEQVLSRLRLYDADGFVTNELSVQFSPLQAGVIEVEPLMAGCKFEAGLKHGHLEIRSRRGFSHLCRLHSREGASLMGPPALLSSTRRVFFPVLFSAERSSFLCLINQGDTQAALRARFFFGKRSPEATWEVPAHGARVISMASEFGEYVDYPAGTQAQAYIRLAVRSDSIVGAQLIDRAKGSKEGSIFTVVS